MPSITDSLTTYIFSILGWHYTKQVLLADDIFNVSDQIDILVEASLFCEILVKGHNDLGRNLPSLQNTIFGYIVTGKITYPINDFKGDTRCHFLSEGDFDINVDRFDLQKCWSCEEPKHSTILSDDDAYCKKYFQSTLSRAENGQFFVKIYPLDLGESKSLAFVKLGG